MCACAWTECRYIDHFERIRRIVYRMCWALLMDTCLQPHQIKMPTNKSAMMPPPTYRIVQCVCVCACVRVRVSVRVTKRERKRKGKGGGGRQSVCVDVNEERFCDNI